MGHYSQFSVSDGLGQVKQGPMVPAFLDVFPNTYSNLFIVMNLLPGVVVV